MEDFLKKLNHAVLDIDLSFPINKDAPHSIFIIGVPRSGTTLISQILAACTDAAYVNNVMARFWMAPAVGARLSMEVSRRRMFTGVSTFGQTQCAEEPHEFGGFWRSVLNYKDMNQKESDADIEWEYLATTLRRIATVFGKPVVYKVFQLYWHLESFHKFVPNSKWIWVRRNPIDNALSLLHLRKEKTGGLETWFSARPIGAEKYYNEPPWVQVAAQVKFIEDWIERQLTQIPPSASLQIDLDELCRDPDRVTRSLAVNLNLQIFEENIKNIATKIHPEVFDQNDKVLKKLIADVFRAGF